MYCRDLKPYTVTQGVRRPDGTIYVRTWHPACSKWTCRDCRKVRMESVARLLIMNCGIDAELYAGCLAKGERDSARRRWERAGGKGRMWLPLSGGRHLHVADVAFMPPGRGGRRMPAAEVARVLRDPLLGVTAGPRWAGGWHPRPEEGNDGVMLFRAALTGEDIDRLCHITGLPRLIFVDFADLDEETAHEVARALAAWELEWRGPREGEPL